MEINLSEKIVTNRLLNRTLLCFSSDDIRIPPKDITLKSIIHSENGHIRYYEASYMNKNVMVKDFSFMDDMLNDEIDETFNESQSIYSRFLLDSTCLSNFVHENIAFFYGASLKFDDNTLEPHKRNIMLVMEYCSKGTLQRFLPMIESNWAVKLCIARDILNAISFLHDKDMIHGNILSSNIFITEDMIGKIVDFSRVHSQQCSSSLGSSSDIYSFGLVLLELIASNLTSVSLHECHPSTIVNPYSKLFCEKGDVLVNVDLEDQLNLIYTQLKTVSILPSCPGALRTLAFQCCNPSAMSRPTASKCIEELDIMLVDIGLHTNEWHYPHFKSVVPKLPDVSSIPPLFCPSTNNSSSSGARSIPPSPPPYSLDDESTGGTLLSTMVADNSAGAEEVPVVVLVLDEHISEDMGDSHTSCSTNDINIKNHLPVVIDYILDKVSQNIESIPVNVSKTIENIPVNVSKTIENIPVNVPEPTMESSLLKQGENVVDIPSLRMLANFLKDVESAVPVFDETNPVSYELIVPSKSTSRKKQIQENRQFFLENKVAELESRLEQIINMTAAGATTGSSSRRTSQSSTTTIGITTQHPIISSSTENHLDVDSIVADIITSNLDDDSISLVSTNINSNATKIPTSTATAISIPLEVTKTVEVYTNLNKLSLKEKVSNINENNAPHSLHTTSFGIPSPHTNAVLPNNKELERGITSNNSPIVPASSSSKGLMSTHKPSLTPANKMSLTDNSVFAKTILTFSPPSRRFPPTSIASPNQQIQTTFHPIVPIVASESTATKSEYISASKLGLESPVPSVSYKGYICASTVGLESPVPSLSYKKTNVDSERKSLPFTKQAESISTTKEPPNKENKNSKFLAIDEKLGFVQAQMEKVLDLLERKPELELTSLSLPPQQEQYQHIVEVDTMEYINALSSSSVCSQSDIDVNEIEHPFNEMNMLLESKINARNYATLLKQTLPHNNNNISLNKPKLSPVHHPATDLFMSKILHSQYNHNFSSSTSSSDPYNETKTDAKEQVVNNNNNNNNDMVLKSSRSFLNSLDSLKEDLDAKSSKTTLMENTDKQYLSSTNPHKLVIETPYRSQQLYQPDDDVYLSNKFENNRSISISNNNSNNNNNNVSSSSKKENALKSFTQLIKKCKQMSAAVDEVVGSLDDNMNNFEERKRMYQAIQQAQSVFSESSSYANRDLFRNYFNVDHHNIVNKSPIPTTSSSSSSKINRSRTINMMDRSPVFLSPSRRPPIPHEVFTSNIVETNTRATTTSNNNNNMRSYHDEMNKRSSSNHIHSERRRGRSRERRSNSSSNANNNTDRRSRSNERSLGSRSKSPTTSATFRNTIPKEILSPHKNPITYSFGMDRNERVISDRVEDRYISSNYGIMKQNFSSNLNHSDKYNSNAEIEIKSRSKSPTSSIRNTIPKEILSPHKNPITYSFGMDRNERVISDKVEDRYISSNYAIMKQNFNTNDNY